MKKLFYAILLIGLVGCGNDTKTLPNNLRVYESVYDQKYNFGGAYGAEEVKPFGGLNGKVKQIITELDTIRFYPNGLVDEIVSNSGTVERYTYCYKYRNDKLFRKILHNGTVCFEDVTHYNSGLPLTRESSAGIEKWRYDYDGNLLDYHRNDTLLLERNFYAGIEEYDYAKNTFTTTHKNELGKIAYINHYDGTSMKFTYIDEYFYEDDGSYTIRSVAHNDTYSFHSYDKYGNFLSDKHSSCEYEYDSLGNWIKMTMFSPYTLEETCEVRKITYWE